MTEVDFRTGYQALEPAKGWIARFEGCVVLTTEMLTGVRFNGKEYVVTVKTDNPAGLIMRALEEGFDI